MKTHMKSTTDLNETLCGITIRPGFKLTENSFDPISVNEVTCERCLKIINGTRRV